MLDAKQVFEILIREHSQMLLTYLRASVGASHQVDELFQETMLTAWQRLDSFDQRRPFAPWLRGIAKNHLLAFYRKNQHEQLMSNEQVLEHIDYAMAQIDKQAGDNWQDKLTPLHICIQQLPDSYRNAIEARYLHNQKPQAISKQSNIHPETLKKRLQRAKKRLFTCLNSKITLESNNESTSY